MEFEDWHKALDKLCLKAYFVDTEMMGFDVSELKNFWEQDFTPLELADHFGSKYNLTHAEEVMLRG